MTNPSKVKSTATNVLLKYGETVTFRRDTEEEYDPTTGEAPTITSQTFSGKGYPGNYKNFETSETTVLRTDTKLIVADIGTPPKVGDIVTLTSREGEFRVLDVAIYPMSGVDVAYECHLR